MSIHNVCFHGKIMISRAMKTIKLNVYTQEFKQYTIQGKGPYAIYRP